MPRSELPVAALTTDRKWLPLFLVLALAEARLADRIAELERKDPA